MFFKIKDSSQKPNDLLSFFTATIFKGPGNQFSKFTLEIYKYSFCSEDLNSR